MSTRLIQLCNRNTLRKGAHALAAATAILVSAAAGADVSQTPLYLGGGNVPGNLTLVPSVEWPTINSVANLGDYADTREYLGYFDPNKCYLYAYDATETLRHFYPVAPAKGHRCEGQWSGNFMNWAATQTVDPFRSVLTGGNRVKDTATETWLEKARHDGQGGTNIFPNRRLPGTGDNAALVSGATPFNANWIRMRIESLGNKMRFRLEADDVNTNVTSYDPAAALEVRPYEVSVRVSVCVPGLLESNCRQYSSGYKPEGLIQQYADELRVGVFGYLNDPSMLRDGGALRAKQKFVGENVVIPGGGQAPNPANEWDAATGVLIANPNPADASATATEFSTAVSQSGVINYLNKFGQMTTNTHKSYDPVSELYYTALRYLKNQGNVPEYTSMAGATDANRARYADGFPVITNWDDPVQYECQKNVILGIGDVYTHRDKNLPGSTYGTDEPAKPGAVSGDATVDVLTWTNRVGQAEGLGNIANFNSWSGRNNSAYMAGLAYYANTTDIRPDLAGTQTVSTHWVDVLEAQSLEAPVENQYYLATKYGGFDAPDDADFDPATFVGALPVEWWHTNEDTLVSFGPNANPAGYSFPRPDNYYLAGGASQMVESLTTAFARISIEMRSSASAVASNSTRVDTDTAVFQAAFDSHRWSGEVLAFRVDDTGNIASDPEWDAAERLDALDEADLIKRKIYTIEPPTSGGGGALLSKSGVAFEWDSLASEQQDALRQTPGDGTLVTEVEGELRLDFLRGSRSSEQPGGPLRQRDSRLGDVVNSSPQYIHNQDFGYSLLAGSGAFPADVGAAYRTFRQSATYKSRRPILVVGANDGMLHVFDAGLDANGGNELFAFIPYAAFEHLYELTLQTYGHRYFVDGTARVADAWLGSSEGWRTLAVGTTGAGGRSVFALDVTDPDDMSADSVLWEFTHPDMGHTLIQPAVAPLPNGTFGVVVTSGYGAAGGGHIWILDPADGSIMHTISLPDSGDLGAPLLADLDSDRVADRLYVGDTEGQLWRIDLDGDDESDWTAPADLMDGDSPLPLFVATDDAGEPQAITAPPTSAFNENGEHMVFFGTGSFYRVDDNVVPDDPGVDTFYGIIDRGKPIAGRDELLEQEILTEQGAGGERVRGVTANEMEGGESGWYLDLVWKDAYGGPGPLGERVVSGALVRGDRVIFTTLIPNADPCAYGGDSWLMELNAFYGRRLDYSVFDLDDDGNFDADDWITVTLPDGTTVEIPPSAVAPDIGIMQPPAVITGIGDDQDEVKVVSGSSGAIIRISERGGINGGRQSWRQQR